MIVFELSSPRAKAAIILLLGWLVLDASAALAQSGIPTDSGRDPQLERLNRFNIEQRQNLERDRAVRAQQRAAQQRIIELNNQRREDLRQRLEDVQESIRDRQNYQLRSFRNHNEARREIQRSNRLDRARDVSRERTSGATAAQRNLRNNQRQLRTRSTIQLRQQRRASSNRFLSERYIRSRRQR